MFDADHPDYEIGKLWAKHAYMDFSIEQLSESTIYLEPLEFAEKLLEFTSKWLRYERAREICVLGAWLDTYNTPGEREVAQQWSWILLSWMNYEDLLAWMSAKEISQHEVMEIALAGEWKKYLAQ